MQNIKNMKNVEDKEQITDPMVNTNFVFDQQMNNNYRSVRFGIQRSKDDMLGVLPKSIVVFPQSLKVFA